MMTKARETSRAAQTFSLITAVVFILVTAWIMWQCLGMFPFRVLIVWIYNNTGESVFAASLFHATANVSQFLFPNYGSHYDPFVAFILLTVTAAAVTFLFGPKTLARYRPGRLAARASGRALSAKGVRRREVENEP